MEHYFSRCLAALEPLGDCVEPRDGGSEQFGATQLVVADNWGGLFEHPEERDLGFSVIDVFGSAQIRHEHDSTSIDSSPSPSEQEQHALDAAAIEEIEPEAYPHQIQKLQDEIWELAISPRRHDSLSAPGPDAVFGSARSTGRDSFRPILLRGDEPKFRLEISVSEASERERELLVLGNVVSAPCASRLRRPRRIPPRPPRGCCPRSPRLHRPRRAPPRRRPWRALPRSPRRRRLWEIPLRRRPRRALPRPRRRGRPPRLLARVRGRRPRLRAGARAPGRGAVLRPVRVVPCSAAAALARVVPALYIWAASRQCALPSIFPDEIHILAEQTHVVVSCEPETGRVATLDIPTRVSFVPGRSRSRSSSSTSICPHAVLLHHRQCRAAHPLPLRPEAGVLISRVPVVSGGAGDLWALDAYGKKPSARVCLDSTGVVRAAELTIIEGCLLQFNAVSIDYASTHVIELIGNIHVQLTALCDIKARYNTIVYPPHCNGVVLFGHVTVVQEAREVFEELAKLLSEILWPPPMHISNKQCSASTVPCSVDKSVQSCFLPPTCCCWDAMLYWEHRQWPPPTELRLVICEAVLHPLLWLFSAPLVAQMSWPPFMLFEIKGDAVLLWPLPWLFFFGSAAPVQSKKHVPQLLGLSFPSGALPQHVLQLLLVIGNIQRNNYLSGDMFMFLLLYWLTSVGACRSVVLWYHLHLSVSVGGGSVTIGDLSADEEIGFLVILCFSLLAVQYRHPWPPPHIQVQFECGSANVRSLPWPYFTLGNCCSMSEAVCWKPPWPSFSMLMRCFVSGSCGRLWKPPWPIQIGQQISKVQKRHLQCGGHGHARALGLQEGATEDHAVGGCIHAGVASIGHVLGCHNKTRSAMQPGSSMSRRLPTHKLWNFIATDASSPSTSSTA